jgi:hypothetical protein
MNIQPPVAAELWQQIPPLVQSALLEAWWQAEQRCQSLEDQFRQLRDHLDRKAPPPNSLASTFTPAERKDVSPAFVPPMLTPLDKLSQSPVLPEKETTLNRGRRRRHHRTRAEKRARRWEKMAEWARRYLLWHALVVAIVLALWVLLTLIRPS